MPEESVLASFDMPTGHLMTVRLEFDPRGKVLDLAIVLRLPDGIEIARLDTCHGELHTHYYGQDGRQPEIRRVRQRLPDAPRERADLLHRSYESCYDDMRKVAEGRAP